MGEYVVVMRGPASVAFKPNERIQITPLPDVKYTFLTRYEDKGFDTDIPTDIWVEIVGPASSIEEAVGKYANVASSLANIIAFANNASIGPLEVELVFDRTVELKEHDYFQCFVPQARSTVFPARNVDIYATKDLIEAIGQHEKHKRLMTAIMQYSIALSYWRPEERIQILAHLFMGMEALKVVVRKQMCRERGVKEAELAKSFGLKLSEHSILKRWCLKLLHLDLQQKNRLISSLDNEIRRKILFQGDSECHRKAKKASDAFEHGFLVTDEIRPLAHEVDIQTANYFREALIKYSGISEKSSEILLGAPYDLPRGPLRLQKYVWAKIKGDADKLAAKDQEYPYLMWTTKLENVRIDENGHYIITPSESWTARLGEGVDLTFNRHEIWDGSTIKKQAIPTMDKK